MIVTMHELVSFVSLILNKVIRWFCWKSNNNLDFIDFFLSSLLNMNNWNHAKQNTLLRAVCVYVIQFGICCILNWNSSVEENNNAQKQRSHKDQWRTSFVVSAFDTKSTEWKTSRDLNAVIVQRVVVVVGAHFDNVRR